MRFAAAEIPKFPHFTRTLVSFLLFLLLPLPLLSQAGQKIPKPLTGIGITEKLGDEIDLSIPFRNEKGEEVQIGQYFDGRRPVLVNLVYFECPSICTFALNGMVKSVKNLSLNPGKDYQIVTISIDPREKPLMAREKKEAYLEMLGKEGAGPAWHFLTGKEENIKRLASQIGFSYRWDKEQEEYAHAAGIFVLTPKGKISRVFYGIDYLPKNLRLGLLEASDGKIGTVVDRIIMFCFRYDSERRGYSLIAFRVVQAGAGTMVLFLGGFYFAFFRRLLRKRDEEEDNPGKPGE